MPLLASIKMEQKNTSPSAAAPTPPARYYLPSPEALIDATSSKDTNDDEFASRLPVGADADKAWNPSRRDFLKLMGFSLAAASVAACEAPVRKAIPYLNKPVDVNPGIANHYATTYVQGATACGLVVRAREGRPIKVAGNPKDPLSQGGVSAAVEASVLDLYDKARYNGPQKEKQRITWQELDDEVITALEEANAYAQPIYLFSHSLASPLKQESLDKLSSRYEALRVVYYDNPSYSALLDAHEDAFGSRILPGYNLEACRCIFSLGADFLGTWLAPVRFAKGFAASRKAQRTNSPMSRLHVWESNFSLTGANADHRLGIKAHQEALVLAHLYNLLARSTQGSAPSRTLENLEPLSQAHQEALVRVAEDLWRNKGRALVMCGANNYEAQQLACAINVQLGNYGYGKRKPLNWRQPFYFAKGDDKALATAIDDLLSGNAAGVLFHGCNPVYDHPRGKEIQEALAGIPLTLSMATHPDETSEAVRYVAPDNHYLESWGDNEAVHGHISLMQPCISPLFDTRQAVSSFSSWAGQPTSSAYDLLKESWQRRYGGDKDALSFQSFFDSCLYEGYYKVPTQEAQKNDIGRYNGKPSTLSVTKTDDDTGLQLMPYYSVALGNGAQAGNPWLQELPDPLTKVCWQNVLCVSMADASRLGIATNYNTTSLVTLKVGDTSLQLPALVQPGQQAGTLGLAVGYGRRVSNPVGKDVGVDMYPLLSLSQEGYRQLRVKAPVSLVVDGTTEVAMMQTQHTYMGRQTVIQETTKEAYAKDPAAGRYSPKVATWEGAKPPGDISLWKGFSYENHHWGMAIDLTSCTGCNACVVSCQVENNIPVVGKQEVINRREMHWLRIDRYYSSAADPHDRSPKGLAALEKATANPEVVFQPMLCQHCNNAPCEAVCPVAATTHSSEGLNQMTYNRCVGTRYCANNCPYKVRRFNWFKYHDNDQFAVNTAMYDALGKMTLNPDVTVRSRGVMEKCSFCVQRIQAGKLQAKKAGRRPVDGEIQTACQTACNADAILFGDLNDPQSAISKRLAFKHDKEKGYRTEEPRAYQVLEELSVKPNVWYLTKIKNPLPS